MDITFAHVNLIARDWRSLSKFYIDVFGCQPQYPERDLGGEWVERLTGIKGARIRGVHLTLPGYDRRPTLEIFEYDPGLSKDVYRINQQGLGHIAFHVDDLETLAARLVDHGGRMLGEIIRKDFGALGLLTVFYAQDPEGNFLEIQNWGK